MALLIGGTSGAQSSVPCTAIENDAERLACYDRALRPSGPPAAERPAAPAAASEPGRPAELGRGETGVRAPAAAAPSPAPAPVHTAPEVRSVAVVEVRALAGRPATFTTRAGEVWIQTDNQRPRFPEAPFDAEIKPGAMGSFFLVPKDHGRAIRVRRGE